MNMNTTKQKRSRQRWLAVGTVLVAGAAVMAGAAVTSAAIDNAEDPGETISMDLVDRDADGNWFACAVDDVLWDDVTAVTVDDVAITDTLDELHLDDIGISIQEVDGLLGEVDTVDLDEALSIELPEPGDIRAGTDDECAELTAFVLEPAGFAIEVGTASAD